MCASASVFARHSARLRPASLSGASVSSETLSAWRTKKMVRMFWACAPGSNANGTTRQRTAILAGILKKNPPFRLLFHRRRPAHPQNEGWMIELALVRIDRAARVEPKNLVREVES